MRTKAVLIIGGSGYLGTHLALRMRERYKVFATYHSHPLAIPGVTMLPLELGSRNWIKRVVYTAKPEVIVFAAGSNSVAAADADPHAADSVHTSGVATVCNVAEILQPKFVYLSNCYAFDGTKGNYRESDTVLPTTMLGKAKVSGENFIRGKCLNYVIIRSSPVFGRGNGVNLSFLDRLRMALDRGQRLELSSDEIHSFAPVDGLMGLIERVAESGVRNRTLHYGGLTKVDQCEFARAFARRLGYDPGLIVARKRGAGPHTPQVADYSLNSSGVAEGLKIQPFLLEEGLDLIQQKLVACA